MGQNVTPTHPRHDIDVRIAKRFVGVAAKQVADCARAILVALALPPRQLSVLLHGDRAMRALNARWRGKDAVTDVLSFPQTSWPARRREVLAPLGDVVVCVPEARRQAKAYGHALADELTVLLIHGILHLLGHEHEQGGKQAARMRRAEALVLTKVHASGTAVRSLLSR